MDISVGSIDHLVLDTSVIGPLKTNAGNKNLHIRSSYPGVGDLAMTYNDLPTGSVRVEGEKYYIIDSNQSTIGGVVSRGGGGTRGWVVWNGSAWTLMSK
jgi:hypothetical protein